MRTEIRLFIRYLYPGSFFPEESSKQVKNTNMPTTVPSDCYAFNFYQTEVAIGDGGKEYIGETKSIGKTHIIGKAIHVDDIPDKDNGHSTDTLKRNIRSNSPTKTAIKTHLGNWQMVDDYHDVVSPTQFKFGKPTIYESVKK